MFKNVFNLITAFYNEFGVTNYLKNVYCFVYSVFL